MSPAPARTVRRSVQRVMAMVLLALLPAALAKIALVSMDIAWQLPFAVSIALAFEWAMLRLRKQPHRPYLADMSAPVTAVLLTLLLPPTTPWWMLCAAVFSAIVISKHLYGGIGSNPFNPAMVGYAVLLVFFPANFSDAANQGAWPQTTQLWLVGMYALGGIWLVWKNIIPLHTPLAMLVGAAIAALAIHFSGASAAGSTLHTWFPAALIMAAFFVVTDPVTGCLSARGRIFFGVGAGLLTVFLTRFGATADGLPFAVLLMNLAAPWLDQHTRPARRSPGAVR